jgi:hypothetical protein
MTGNDGDAGHVQLDRPADDLCGHEQRFDREP